MVPDIRISLYITYLCAAAYVGCFQDIETSPQLKYQFNNNSVTTELCIAHCRNAGYRYCGLQVRGMLLYVCVYVCIYNVCVSPSASSDFRL